MYCNFSYIYIYIYYSILTRLIIIFHINNVQTQCFMLLDPEHMHKGMKSEIQELIDLVRNLSQVNTVKQC